MALVFQDEFVGTDGQILADRTGWSETGNVGVRGNLTILSNMLNATGAGSPLAYAAYADAGVDDHWASFEIDPAFPVGQYFYPYVTPNGASAPQDYMRVNVSSATTISVRAETSADGRIINVNLTASTSEAGGFPLVAGDVIEVRRVGNTVDLYKNATDGVGGVHLNQLLPIDVSGTTVGLPASQLSGFMNNSVGMFDVFKIGNFGAAATIDDVDGDGEITDGQGTATLTTSGFGSDINSITVSDGTFTTANLFAGGSGGNWTWSIPNILDQASDSAPGQPNWLEGSLEVIASDGVDTATAAFNWNPQLDSTTQVVVGAVDVEGSIYKDRPTLPSDNSANYYPTTQNTSIDQTGIISTDAEQVDGVLWDIDTGILENWTFVVSNGPVEPGEVSPPIVQIVGGVAYSNGEALLDGSHVFVSPFGNLTNRPNGSPIVRGLTVSGSDLMADGVTLTAPNNLFIAPSGGLTTEPNGAPVAVFVE